MEFLNIGGGELLVIVLLAIILFGPEDILKIMRTIGGYVRKIQQMWVQVSSGLKGEFITDELIPEEIQETIKDTRDSVTEVKKTLAEVKASAKADMNETKATVAEVTATLAEVKTSVETSMREIPKALDVSSAVAAMDAKSSEAPEAHMASTSDFPIETDILEGKPLETAPSPSEPVAPEILPANEDI